MTRATDGSLKVTFRDLAKNPLLALLCIVGLGGSGTGAVSLFSVASKADIQRVENKVDAIAGDVAELKIEARARELSESKRLGMVGH